MNEKKAMCREALEKLEKPSTELQIVMAATMHGYEAGYRAAMETEKVS